jgi:hypothetical protein
MCQGVSSKQRAGRKFFKGYGNNTIQIEKCKLQKAK